MRMSSLLLRTLRDDPADTDSAGYALLVRGGYVRRLASGVYTFLPLGLRVLHRIEAVVRRELDRAGMQELLMPALSPIELWEQSGRAARFGTDALPALTVDGRGGTYVLGPTHEEVVTVTVGQEVESYRQLPVTVYQIQSKFRDEARPRYGLVRTKELVMCDAYSFDANPEGMAATYENAVAAYLRIFEAVELAVTPVVAQSGAIGGDVNHEFMVPSPIGEDHFASCAACGYHANTEAAERRAPAARTVGDGPAMEAVATPGVAAIDEVVAFFGDVSAPETVKAMAATTGTGDIVVVCVRGDREVRLPHGWDLLDDAALAAHPHLHKGAIGPAGLAPHGIAVVADAELVALGGPFVAGGNAPETHVRGLVFGRDVTPDQVGSFVVVEAGDGCPNCGSPLELIRSVEAAHTFQLGLQYTQKMPGSTFLDENGEQVPMWMGCYGIGVSRLMGVLAEAHHDDRGLTWPAAIAPYDLHLVALGANKNPAVADAADALCARLEDQGFSVLYDDRDVSPGVKFADADLIGAPIRLVLGAKGLDRGVVEWRRRRTGDEGECALEGPFEALA